MKLLNVNEDGHCERHGVSRLAKTCAEKKRRLTSRVVGRDEASFGRILLAGEDEINPRSVLELGEKVKQDRDDRIRPAGSAKAHGVRQGQHKDATMSTKRSHLQAVAILTLLLR